MTPDTKIDETLQKSFHAALLLTGSVEAAERAVTNAVAALTSDCPWKALLVEAARAALEQNCLSSDWSPILPQDLRALSLLSPTGRLCFILRVLLGFDSSTCSEILRFSKLEFEEALYKSFLDLPRAMGVWFASKHGPMPVFL